MTASHKVYLLTAPPALEDKQRYSRLHYWIENSPMVSGYWNYLPFIYAIKSFYTSTDITLNLIPVLGAGFLVAEINIMNLDGQINKDAWHWFYEPPTRTTGSVQPLGLGQARLGDLGEPPLKR